MGKEKLKPCPFCGKKKITLWPMGADDYGANKWGSPVCEGCGATIHENFDTPEDTKAMVAAWNRRRGK